MVSSDATARKMIEEFFGQELSQEELEQLVPQVRHQLEISRQLQELDLGSDDPRATHYIRDRRLVP